MARKFYTILFSITQFLFPLIHGVHLPGPCPEMEPSEKVFEIFVNQRIMYMIPFASHISESYFFQEVSPLRRINCYVVYSKTPDSISLNYIAKYKKYGRQELIGYLKEYQNGSYLMESGIYDATSGEQSECHPKITEQIRFWFYKNVTLLWSCKEINGGEYHDEAVLILNFLRRYYLPPGEIFWNMECIEAINKYLKKPLIEYIIVPSEDWYCASPHPTHFPCYTRYSFQTFIVLLLFVGLVIVLLNCD